MTLVLESGATVIFPSQVNIAKLAKHTSGLAFTMFQRAYADAHREISQLTVPLEADSEAILSYMYVCVCVCACV
jgi:hypothetical protein